ncbi:MAG: haloalkane dehalogenase [Agitococcus sp.]|nr:haloalkane dehalogenase [Agitococcus sp.]
MKYLRTPDDCFADLEGYAFEPHYLMVDDTEGGELRLHYLDEGHPEAPVVLMLHGEPSWSYLYRKMIPVVVKAGYRVIAPDLIGFGRSDKPTEQSDYTHVRHVQWIGSVLTQLQLKNITLVCQDWGGLIGLRLVAERSEDFARVVAANTMLPAFPMKSPALKPVFSAWKKLRATVGFGAWYSFSQLYPSWTAGFVLQMGTAVKMSSAVKAAYNAPYPSQEYMAGARVFPRLVPSDMRNNAQAWKKLVQWQKPFLCAFSDKDPIMSSMAGVFPALIPGCAGQAHTTIKNGGHFLQEDQGEELAQVVVKFMQANPLK